MICIIRQFFLYLTFLVECENGHYGRWLFTCISLQGNRRIIGKIFFNSIQIKSQLNFKKANYDGLLYTLASTNWSEILQP